MLSHRRFPHVDICSRRAQSLLMLSELLPSFRLAPMQLTITQNGLAGMLLCPLGLG